MVGVKMGWGEAKGDIILKGYHPRGVRDKLNNAINLQGRI